MASAAKPKKEISMEEALWKSADKLRGSVEPAEYKHVVLSLFFLKFASDKFEECRNKIISTHGEKYADMKPFYTQENVFYLPEESRWKYIIENAKMKDYTAGGKSGTAQKIPRSAGTYIVSFCGFSPVENPQVLVYVVIDEIQRDSQTNTGLAVEIAKKVLEGSLKELNVAKSSKK